MGGGAGEEVNHISCSGVAARAREVCIWYTQWTAGSWARREGPEHTHNSCSSRTPILQEMLTDHWKKSNTKRPSMTFHYTPTTTTQPASCMDGANPPQQPFTHWQPLRLCPMEGLCQANGGGCDKGQIERGCTHPNSRHINRVRRQSTAPETQAQLEASKAASLAHTCTAHGRLGSAILLWLSATTELGDLSHLKLCSTTHDVHMNREKKVESLSPVYPLAIQVLLLLQ